VIKSPSIPPQLALVLPYVPLQIEWDDLVHELKVAHPGIINIVRLKNRAQQPVRAVKLELGSSKLRNDLLSTGEISAIHMKFKVVEYFAQANVLICSNCYGIGHFRKNCPQREEATCKTCGDKCPDLKDHKCSGVAKCIHCGGPHNSNDTKCKVVKDYRAALTRNLLQKNPAANTETATGHPSATDILQCGSMEGHLPYATVAQMGPLNTNEVIIKKLDRVLATVEEESSATRGALTEVKCELQKRYEETQQYVKNLENNVKMLEMKLEDLSVQTLTMLQNICTSLLDPQGVQSTKWKSYWQEQFKVLGDLRSALSKPPS
jgi:chemotaxis protein histidine kinase CheA